MPVFENCRCVPDYQSNASVLSLGNGTAENGICATECHTLPLFLVLVGIVLFLVFMLKIPTVIITLRYVFSLLVLLSTHACGGHGYLTSSGIARMSKLRGHIMGTFSVPNTHLLGELGHTPAMKIL